MDSLDLDCTRRYVDALSAAPGPSPAAGAPAPRRLSEAARSRAGAALLDAFIRLFPEASAVSRHAALLVGCVEDGLATFDDLRAARYPEEVVQLVASAALPPGPRRPDYLDWIRNLAERGPIEALRIRLADAALPRPGLPGVVRDAARRVLEEALRRRAPKPRPR